MDTWNGESVELPRLKENAEKGIFDWNIYNCAQFKFLADYVNNTLTEEEEKLITDKGLTKEDIKITADAQINLKNNLDLGARFDESGNMTSGTAWIPVGLLEANTLLGTFEGNNHYITGIYINSPTTNFVGIFGNANSICNLSVRNSYIVGSGNVGGIVGNVSDGSVYNCSNIKTTVKGNYKNTGGIVGQLSGNMENCYNTGEILSSYFGVGGIVGYTLVNSNITKCYNAGKIINTLEGNAVAGGIVGNTESPTHINYCYNIGDVLCTGYGAGGIVASIGNGSTITDCYNFGNVIGTKYATGSGESKIGGIFGDSYKSTITNCHNVGTITGTGKWRGSIGGDIYTTTLSNSNYLKGSCSGGIGTNSSSTITNCLEKETITGQNIYEWLSVTSNNWKIDSNKNNGYPILSWQ